MDLLSLQKNGAFYNLVSILDMNLSMSCSGTILGVENSEYCLKRFSNRDVRTKLQLTPFLKVRETVELTFCLP